MQARSTKFCRVIINSRRIESMTTVGNISMIATALFCILHFVPFYRICGNAPRKAQSPLFRFYY